MCTGDSLAVAEGTCLVVLLARSWIGRIARMQAVSKASKLLTALAEQKLYDKAALEASRRTRPHRVCGLAASSMARIVGSSRYSTPVMVLLRVRSVLT